VPTDVPGLLTALDALREGGVIAYPTETFYGLGALASRPAALARLARLKERSPSGPLLLLVPGLAALLDFGLASAPLPAAAEPLAARFWPGPLTLVVDAAPGLSPHLVGPDGGVAVRHSSHPVAGALVDRLGEPLTATSANFRAEPPATTPDHIRASGLAALLDFVLEAGQTPGDRPSTVLRLFGDRAALLREGAIPRSALEPVLSFLSVPLG
jgi:L-threonylcarbamoyladenylate synthase